jgi:preprotein translocase subunit SecA
MGPTARDEISEVIARTVEEYTPGDFVEDWDFEGLVDGLQSIFPVDVDPQELRAESLGHEELTEKLQTAARELYDEREEVLGDELTRALERYLLLQIIDNRWREHLYDMDYLREGIHLRGFAQIEPIIAYKNEAFTLFQDLMNSIWSDFARMIYNVEVEVEGNEDAGQTFAAQQASGPSRIQYSGPADAQVSGYGQAAAGATGLLEQPQQYAEEEEIPVIPVEQRRVDDHEQVGRNDPCWCGSGKKYKKCHGT